MMQDETPRYMASTSSWQQRARSPTGGQRQAERSRRRQFSTSGQLEGLLPKEGETQEHRGSPSLEELQRVQKTLAARLIKLDEGLRERDSQLAELRVRYQEVQKTNEEWRSRACNAEEEMAVLRRMLEERTQEIQRLQSQLSEAVAGPRAAAA
mmetsp:Transcript_30011/g.70685  ORF Transcript_30011/g.70685 Transcript_30011/m.70685 type:complete len:153 (-) Transcript_30011:189-647(-)|eukprot:s3647_g2.t1